MRGSTFLEMMIATLIMAVVVAGVFPIMLTSRANQGRASQKLAASHYARSLLEQLKAYVADPALRAANPALLPNSGQLMASGWKDDCASQCATYPGCYALDASANCVHDVSGMLPADFRGVHGGKLTYTVTPVAAGGYELSRVDVRVYWNAPQ